VTGFCGAEVAAGESVAGAFGCAPPVAGVVLGAGGVGGAFGATTLDVGATAFGATALEVGVVPGAAVPGPLVTVAVGPAAPGPVAGEAAGTRAVGVSAAGSAVRVADDVRSGFA
jgi:hypothetical protein